MVEGTEGKAGSRFAAYFGKFKGAGEGGTPMPPWTHTAWSFANSFVGISLLGAAHTYVLEPRFHLPLEVPAFGAMAVILFSACGAPVAQPYNAFVGNCLGALVGVAVQKAVEAAGLGSWLWLAAALAVSLTIVVQELTKSVHPPGGATALIFVLVVPMHKLGFMYAVSPALVGTLILVAVAVVMNNFSEARAYPQLWFPGQPVAEKPDDHAMELLQVEEHGDGDESEEEERCGCLRAYFQKWKGSGGGGMPLPPISQTFISWLGAFVGIGALGLIHTYFALPKAHLSMLVASFGAMAVLVFSTWKVPLAQPMNVILGNAIGGLVGVAVVFAVELAGMKDWFWLAAALAVSLTIAVQERSKTVHPPGGATALLYVVTPAFHQQRLLFAVAPALLGAAVLVAVATVTNNLSPARAYPQRWTFSDKRE